MYRAAFLALAALVTMPAAAAAQAACLVGTNAGLDPVDVETVASIVCSQLRKEGVAVGEPVYEATGEHWRINARPLGRKVFLAVQHVEADGTVSAESELLLRDIEETPVAAPRLVKALVTGKPVETTASVDSLVGEETRRYHKKDGETFFGIGFMGIGVPGTDAAPGGGFLLRWAFETEDFGILSDFRLAGGSPKDDEVLFFSLSVGGRWFLSGANWSPFLGGGLGWTAVEVHEKGAFDGSQSGPGAYLEIGVEALRFYSSRMSIDLRAELPFYELEDDGGSFWGEDERLEREYYVPITVGITYMW